MDRLDLLAAFVRTVETGSLTAAARALRTTQPTISKRLTALEGNVGARLIQRNTQGVRPTEEGQRYYNVARRVLAELEQAESSLQSLRKGLRGKLRLNMPVGLGEMHLTRVAIEFQRLHRELELDLTLTDRVVDLVEDGVDVAIRGGGVTDPSVIARPLGFTAYVLSATPAYLKKNGAPKRPEDLNRHNYVRYGGGESESLLTPEGPMTVRVSSNIEVNNSLALRVAILEGTGIGRCTRWLIDAELKSGALIEVLPGVAPPPVPFHAVYLPSKFLPDKVRAFVDFTAIQMRLLPGWVASAQLR
ncbi:MAG TPA: LysR family transcriptional regulator [Myxococcaceae bacterium]|jgi:DNA-binding transcriptional LysR family regulator|nr:LysR family transcriptional regulator [Myxococcaceae bacterium]